MLPESELIWLYRKNKVFYIQIKIDIYKYIFNIYYNMESFNIMLNKTLRSFIKKYQIKIIEYLKLFYKEIKMLKNLN